MNLLNLGLEVLKSWIGSKLWAISEAEGGDRQALIDLDQGFSPLKYLPAEP
jgi:hypothetical protein